MLLPPPVVESHPEDMASDLRLVQPFPELVEFCSTVNLQVRPWFCSCFAQLNCAAWPRARAHGRHQQDRVLVGQVLTPAVNLLMCASRRSCRWKNTSTCRSLSSCTNSSKRCANVQRKRAPTAMQARVWSRFRATWMFLPRTFSPASLLV